MNVRNSVHKKAKKFQSLLESLYCYPHLNKDRLLLSLGSLGSGNHFIEVCRGKTEDYYMTIHSGSRNLGKQVCEYYQDLAIKECSQDDSRKIIEQLKREGRQQEIQAFLKGRTIGNKDLIPVRGEVFHHYIHDMKIAQEYAMLNREIMGDELIESCDLDVQETFTTMHNYIDTEMMILRKGAVSAKEGEKLLIPMNRRDGSLLCIGKGNPDWNYSAPHGAGRLMSRSEAKRKIDLEVYKQQMKDAHIYATNVDYSTLDEAPDAYKPIEEIMNCIGDTIEIIDQIIPLYNFKSGE